MNKEIIGFSNFWGHKKVIAFRLDKWLFYTIPFNRK